MVIDGRRYRSLGRTAPNVRLEAEVPNTVVVKGESMWPWGHLAVGYLLYSFWCRTENRSPSAVGTVAVAFGTQFPDLVDKPLAWTFSVLPTGRTLTHSLLTATLLLGLLWIGVRRSERRIPLGAFAIGYLSHLAMDSVHPFLQGRLADVSFLLWPVLSPPSYETSKSFSAHFANFGLTPFVLLQFALAGIALGVWIADGSPGIAELHDLWSGVTQDHVGER
ncbi:metal-dependent hydrolase [Haladaptatus sp. R4]|uniref:metal-dependent hydrolase n=1 Tax=Haladaptatus sp. R4 TaxID=1679489 RepID=UPI000AC51A77|nr:metal-dependent hydrolase [Haladaptatus sp. R4]